MTTRQFYYLTVIADLGNLSAAAQKLQISQPALSKFLTEYEASIGFQIFLRYHRHLAPTSVGRCVIEYAHKIVSEQNRLSQSLRTIINRDHAWYPPWNYSQPWFCDLQPDLSDVYGSLPGYFPVSHRTILQ